MTSPPRQPSLVVHVDLTGSRLGPEWLSVDLELAPPGDWTNERIRSETARYYGVPSAQVDDPYPKGRTDLDPACECDMGLRTPLNCWSCTAR